MSEKEEVRQGAGGPAPSIVGITFVLAVVLAVWMSLRMPQPESVVDVERLSRLATSLEDLAGFRSDA